MKIFKLIPIFLILTLFSCEKSEESKTDTPVIESPEFLQKKAKVIASNNNFAFDFFKEIVKLEDKKDNYMVSPVSLSLALGMAYNGANGSTEEAFENILNYNSLSSIEINEINKTLIDNLVTSQEGSLFEVANSIWYRIGFPIKSEFLTLNEDYYSAEVNSLDFADPFAVSIINNWVNIQTHEKIPTIINEIPDNAMLYLINALYFKCSWKYEFDSKDNVDKLFTVESTGENKTIEMMAMEESLLYYENESFESIFLPYKNDKYQMTIFKPINGKKTYDVINSMNGETWNKWKKKYKTEEKVEVNMPKFVFEYENMLNDELINLGLDIAFSPSLADFSGISDVKLFISMVKQKTYIEVNEEGTEAAAVTIIGFETTSIGQSEPKKIIFTLDRSFVFMITEKETDAICFIGRVGDPESE